MQIISLELYKYKRLALNNITYFKIKPTEIIQLIIGSNGSGKSSIIKELTPLPANSQDYAKDGYKVIIIEKNKTTYVLKTVFGIGHANSFIVNEQELNVGGTQQVQRELVKQHFNITPAIHDLMTDQIQFHAMTPAERRKWLTQLSDTNYNFAIQIYQKLKEKHRDLQGALKLNQSRLFHESQKVMDSQQIQTLQQEIIELKQLLDELYKKKSPLAFQLTDITKQIEQLDNNVATESSNLNNLIKKLKQSSKGNNVKDIPMLLDGCKGSVAALEYEMSNCIQLIEKDQQTLYMLTESNISSTSDITNAIEDLERQYKTRKANIKLPCYYENPQLAATSLKLLTESLIDIVSNIEPDPNHHYNQDYFIKNQQEYNTTIKKINALNALHAKQTTYIQTLLNDKNSDPLVCPKCNHNWHLEYSEKKYQEAVSALANIDTDLNNVNHVQTLLTETLNQCQTYQTYYNNYITLRKHHPILNPLWIYLHESQLLYTDPQKIIPIIHTATLDIQTLIELQQLETEISNLNKIKDHQNANDHSNLAQLEDNIEALNLKLHLLKNDITTNKQQISIYESNLANFNNLNTLAAKLSKQIEQRDHLSDTAYTALTKQAVNEMIHLAQQSLTVKEKTLSTTTLQQSVIDSLKKSIREDNEAIKDYALMITELSPTDGLIAKGLLGFINHLIQQINSFITRVWLYPLEILPCNLEDDSELDYKFPVRINDQNVISDISKASSAMKEVINLAFKIVCMKYLNLADSPLYLDEFAASMDQAHRHNAFDVISNLMTQSTFTQIFLVSHYENLYGSLQNAEVTVLCSNNIDVPKNSLFNTHVTIE